MANKENTNHPNTPASELPDDEMNAQYISDQNAVKPAKSPSLIVRNLEIPGQIGSIPVRLHQPSVEVVLPIVLYFHGGGFVSGTLDDADVPAQFIAAHSQSLVLAVGYSLAPTRPFPAAPEDAYAALDWVTKQAVALNADATRLAVAGDDAGGNLAACLTFIARDRNAATIAAQVLISPRLDPSMTRLDDAQKINSDLTAENCAACYRQYLPRTLQRLHPYAAPLESSRLKGLPAAYIATTECDVLHKEAESYAAGLIAAGVPTQVACFAGVARSALPTHVPLLSDVADFLTRRFNRS